MSELTIDELYEELKGIKEQPAFHSVGGLMIFIPFDSTVDLEVAQDGRGERTNIASEIKLVEILRSALDRRMEDRNRRQWANQNAPTSRQEALGATFTPELGPEGGFDD